MLNKNYTSNQVDIGSVEMRNHSGKMIDITKTFKDIEIEEDLFSTALSGKLTMMESADFSQNFPLIGQETINIKFRTSPEMEWRELEFVTFQNAGKTQFGEQTAYCLDFVSEEYLASRSKRIARSFNALAPEEIIKTLITNDLSSKKSVHVHKSASAVTFVATNLFTFELIASICSRTRGAKYSDFGYLFWESIDGYHFQSIDELISEEALKYVYTDRAGTKEPKDSALVINSYMVEESYNLLHRMSEGAFGVEMIAFDPLKRKVKVNEFDYFDDDDYAKLNNMSGNSPKKRMQTSEFKYKESKKRMMLVDNGLRADGKVIRLARLNWIESGYRMRIAIPGNSDLTVGKMMYVTMPSNTGEDMNEAKEDKYISGKYLVTSIRHTITGGQRYTQSCVVVKDSLEESPEDNLETPARMGAV